MMMKKLVEVLDDSDWWYCLRKLFEVECVAQPSGANEESEHWHQLLAKILPCVLIPSDKVWPGNSLKPSGIVWRGGQFQCRS